VNVLTAPSDCAPGLGGAWAASRVHQRGHYALSSVVGFLSYRFQTAVGKFAEPFFGWLEPGPYALIIMLARRLLRAGGMYSCAQ